uniref:Uncharacterized protein n=1 Tax=Glossina austeni TaxID=7395 RepID=A0A1A9VDJ8_GLOAU
MAQNTNRNTEHHTDSEDNMHAGSTLTSASPFFKKKLALPLQNYHNSRCIALIHGVTSFIEIRYLISFLSAQELSLEKKTDFLGGTEISSRLPKETIAKHDATRTNPPALWTALQRCLNPELKPPLVMNWCHWRWSICNTGSQTLAAGDEQFMCDNSDALKILFSPGGELIDFVDGWSEQLGDSEMGDLILASTLLKKYEDIPKLLKTADELGRGSIISDTHLDRYVHGIGSETRNTLFHLHNSRDIILVTTCRHGKSWRELQDARCDEDNREYDSSVTAIFWCIKTSTLSFKTDIALFRKVNLKLTTLMF